MMSYTKSIQIEIHRIKVELKKLEKIKEYYNWSIAHLQEMSVLFEQESKITPSQDCLVGGQELRGHIVTLFRSINNEPLHIKQIEKGLKQLPKPILTTPNRIIAAIYHGKRSYFKSIRRGLYQLQDSFFTDEIRQLKTIQKSVVPSPDYVEAETSASIFQTEEDIETEKRFEEALKRALNVPKNEVLPLHDEIE